APKIEATASSELSSQTATRSPGPTPASSSSDATRAEASSSCRYVQRSPAHTSAVLSGRRSADAASRSSTSTARFHLAAAALTLDERRDLHQRVQIVGNQIVVLDRDRISLLQVTDELEHTRRIH